MNENGPYLREREREGEIIYPSSKNHTIICICILIAFLGFPTSYTSVDSLCPFKRFKYLSG